MEEWGFPLKSIDTSSSSENCRRPFSAPVDDVLERGVHFFGARLLVHDRDEIDHRHVRRRHAHREAVELALQLRQHLADRGGRAGAGRNHRQRRRAGAPQVLVRQVEQLLVVRVRVNRRHPALPDAELLMDDLRERRQAVRRARRVRDDLVRGRIVLFVVDAENERDVRPLGRRRDHDLLGARGEMLGGGAAVGEEPGRLEDDVDAERPSRQLGRVPLRQHFELVAVDRDAVLPGLDACLEVPEHRIVLEQMRERVRAGEVVHRDEVDVLVAERGPHDVPADAAEPVDSDPYRHRCPPDKRFILQ